MASSDFGGNGLGLRDDSARSPPAVASMRVRQGRFEAEGPPNHVLAVSIVNLAIWALVTILASSTVGAMARWL